MSREPTVLPDGDEATTGGRRRRTRENGRRGAVWDDVAWAAPAEPDARRAADDGDRPRGRRAHPVARGVFVGVWVVLILAIPVLTFVGVRAVGDSNAGRELGVEDDPTAEGYEAAVEPTPTLLVVQTDDLGTLTGATVLSLRNSGGGFLTFFPAGTVLELPFTETGEAPMNDIYQGAGETGLEQRIETLLNAATQENVEITNNAQWGSLVAPLGPLTIDNPVALTATDAAGAPVTFAQGEIPVPPEQIGLFVNTRGPDENDLVRLERQEAFWTAWLAAVAASDDPNAVPGETDRGLGRFVRALAAGEALVNTLPVDPIGIPGVGATDTNLYRPDQAAVDELVAQTIPLPVGVGRLRSRVLDGTATEGLAVEASRILVPAGAEIAFIGNAERFGRAETVVQYYDPEEEQQAQALLDALGVGRLVLRENVTDTVDVTVILGADFDPETAPGASAAVDSGESLDPAATTVPVDPFGVTTTLPFGVAPAITPPTEAPAG
ncbi:MAG: LytR C-terminal domain-containing protein [Acidimicrobiales bacterium]|nr:LytR C-terminal domain-containing protein [Acidimicrobiales bacterium]MCB9372856.1 LytR C-terminal domain-containing protein [Microthrixaceae bacterium]